MNKSYTGGCACGAIRCEIPAAPVEALPKGHCGLASGLFRAAPPSVRDRTYAADH